MSDRITLVDGEFTDVVPADDRGFLFGDHVFETMYCNGQGVPLWPFHWRRLEKSCGALGFDAPKEDVLLKDLDRLNHSASGPEPCIVRLTVTRGSSATGYWVPENLTPRRVMQKRKLPNAIARQQSDGIRVKTAAMQLPKADFGWGLKHGNRLFQVMCAQECRQQGMDELLIYREDGGLAEAIASNVILVMSGRLVTSHCPDVWGVGLDWLESVGVSVSAGHLTCLDVENADEVLLINAVSGVRPIVEIDGRSLSIGEVACALQKHWQGILA